MLTVSFVEVLVKLCLCSLEWYTFGCTEMGRYYMIHS